jgi:hypothetical protein
MKSPKKVVGGFENHGGYKEKAVGSPRSILWESGAPKSWRVTTSHAVIPIIGFDSLVG